MELALSDVLHARLRHLIRPWSLAFAIASGTYLYYLTNFPTGNHDWSRMAGLEFYSYQVELGRWLAPAIYALTGYRQLPMLNALVGLAAYVSAGFATCLLIESTTDRRVPTIGLLVAGLLCAIIPWQTWTFFYSWMAAMGPIAQMLCVGSLTYVMRRPSLGRALVSGLVICLSMASYQSAIDTAATLYWLIAMLTLPGWWNGEARRSARRLVAATVSIVVGAGLYKVSLAILGHFRLLAHTYHFDFLGWDVLPSRLWEVLRASVEHLLMAHPFFPGSLKVLLLCMSSVGVAVLFARAYQAPQGSSGTGRWFLGLAAGLLVLVGAALMVFCAKVQFLVSQNAEFFEHRFASFGLTYVYVPFIVVAITYLRGRVQVAYLGGIALCIWVCVISDLSWEDAAVKQDQYDKRALDRVIARIEGIRGFSYRKHYKLVQLGNFGNIRDEYYDYSVGAHSGYLNGSAVPPWKPSVAYEGMEPRFNIDIDLRLETERPTPALMKVLAHVRQSSPWPSPSSVAIVGDHLVVLLSTNQVPEIEQRWSKQGASR